MREGEGVRGVGTDGEEPEGEVAILEGRDVGEGHGDVWPGEVIIDVGDERSFENMNAVSRVPATLPHQTPHTRIKAPHQQKYDFYHIKAIVSTTWTAFPNNSAN